ncbi:class I SAM-dependent methyltransferase [Halomonas elongata]|uniref:Class I SAM-dependent methyltransferase n=1 Tax=Halomonas elongata (strain ATCC 33173 / DSM 2581 / NBRC 15536 / NCIMB 2198 / 1H9) TaxID=768066 RepID=A0A1R4A4H4_HALED|nr:class I SAM-dependent methyltransferase [Halomonas elongata]WBF17718.1 methyltransferase domain-containing protein [Halomonas elongata]WPU46559.1 class I SAM-dependent methyltransferase [Halomonas elongata DSM 2581]SJK83876.1 probable S-adenosylmethionine-dependent methyltransferase [Halomonas elongata DSM 2581]
MVDSRWYDKFAPLYNIGTFADLFYRRARNKAIDELALSPGSTVLDIFCGTGVDFGPLHREIGAQGRILAVDGSEGMLKEAKARSRALEINENCIDFFEADLSRNGGIEKVVSCIHEKKPRHVLFSLGLTCLENWHNFTSEILSAVQSGTRLAIMDAYSKRLTLGSRFISWIGAADCQRTVWRALEENCDSFQWFEFRPFKVLDVSVFVASGTKP